MRAFEAAEVSKAFLINGSELHRQHALVGQVRDMVDFAAGDNRGVSMRRHTSSQCSRHHSLQQNQEIPEQLSNTFLSLPPGNLGFDSRNSDSGEGYHSLPL